MMWGCRTPPKHHNCATFTDKPRNNTARPHNPTHMRARARPNSRARALPTNRHEGGSLT